jgi:hypothetical protein
MTILRVRMQPAARRSAAEPTQDVAGARRMLLDRELHPVALDASVAEALGLADAAAEDTARAPAELWPSLAPLLREVVETGRPLRQVELAGVRIIGGGTPRRWLVSAHPLCAPYGRVQLIELSIQPLV